MAGQRKCELTSAFESLTAAQWLEKHSEVSPDEFAKDPARNRLAILLSRTNHAAFHTGQIILTKCPRMASQSGATDTFQNRTFQHFNDFPVSLPSFWRHANLTPKNLRKVALV
jgi:hypothetical protein